MYYKNIPFKTLVGKTIVDIEIKNNDQITFTANTGEKYTLFHIQDCCESVSIEEIHGELANLLDTPIVMAEEVSNINLPAPQWADSYTWTFYKLATIKGYVTIRWLGESNGYYSEGVDFVIQGRNWEEGDF